MGILLVEHNNNICFDKCCSFSLLLFVCINSSSHYSEDNPLLPTKNIPQGKISEVAKGGQREHVSPTLLQADSNRRKLLLFVG